MGNQGIWEMEYKFNRGVVDILRMTLQQLEDASGTLQDDPAMLEVKRQIVRAIADLEIAKAALGTPSSAL